MNKKVWLKNFLLDYTYLVLNNIYWFIMEAGIIIN